MNDEQSQKIKKITLGFIAGWGFGVLAAIVGFASLFSNPLPGILTLLLAATLLPPINTFIADKFKFSVSGGLKTVISIVLLILIGISIPPSQSGPSENTATQNDQAATSTVTQETQTVQTNTKTTQQPVSPATPAPTAAQTNTTPASTETVSQQNAVRKAKSYLSYAAFSHDGLVAQLEYDQFSHADAVYGADNSGANWNDQAAAKAKSYMSYSAFSRGSLIAQLEYDKFTQAQAEYGATAVGL